MLLLGSFLLSLTTYAAMNISKIDPPFWFTGMNNPELQLMVYGEGIGQASVSVNYPGVSLSSVRNWKATITCLSTCISIKK